MLAPAFGRGQPAPQRLARSIYRLARLCGTNLSMANVSFFRDNWPSAEQTAAAPAAPAPTTTEPTTTPTATSAVDPDSVLGVAMRLQVYDRPTGGYQRSEFGQAWAETDRNGCDQRNDVFRRDMVQRHTKPGTSGCVLAKGVLKDDDHGTSEALWTRFRSAGEVSIARSGTLMFS